MTEKRCSHCHKSKDLSCFSLDGCASWCKECIKIYNRKYYLTHKKEPVCSTALEIPEVYPHGKLTQVLPYLIQVSKTGPYKDIILDRSLEKIREELKV